MVAFIRRWGWNQGFPQDPSAKERRPSASGQGSGAVAQMKLVQKEPTSD